MRHPHPRGSRCLPALALVAIACGRPTANDEVAYSLGHQIGTDLASGDHTVDLDALRRGLEDGLAARAPALDPEQMRQRLLGLKRELPEDQAVDIRDLLAGGAQNAFLAQNAERDGVNELRSGLQVRVLRAGSGVSPTLGDRVQVRYRSTLVDGTVFHDSLAGPTEELAMGALIPGLSAALLRMQQGARWEVFLAPVLAFGDKGPLAQRTVIYDIELVAVKRRAAPPPEEGS